MPGIPLPSMRTIITSGIVALLIHFLVNNFAPLGRLVGPRQ